MKYALSRLVFLLVALGIYRYEYNANSQTSNKTKILSGEVSLSNSYITTTDSCFATPYITTLRDEYSGKCYRLVIKDDSVRNALGNRSEVTGEVGGRTGDCDTFFVKSAKELPEFNVITVRGKLTYPGSYFQDFKTREPVPEDYSVIDECTGDKWILIMENQNTDSLINRNVEAIGKITYDGRGKVMDVKAIRRKL